MDGYNVWKIYRAVSFHLLNAHYDLFAHAGQTKNSELERYLKCREYKYFEFLAKQFTRPNDAVQFFVGNIAYTGRNDIFEAAEAWENYLQWVKHKESLTKLITDELDLLVLPKDLDGNPPKLLVNILNKKVHPQTAVAINRVIPFVDSWLEKSLFGAGKFPLIIKKMDRFVKYNEDVVNSKIKEDCMIK